MCQHACVDQTGAGDERICTGHATLAICIVSRPHSTAQESHNHKAAHVGACTAEHSLCTARLECTWCGWLACRVGMHAAGKRVIKLSAVHDRGERARAGFLDSRDLEGRPADEYGLDWLRQQGIPGSPPPRLWRHLAQQCIPSLQNRRASRLPCRGLPVPSVWQRMISGGGRRRYGRRTAVSGGCGRADRWRRARPPSTRHSLSEQRFTGILRRCRICVLSRHLSAATLSLACFHGCLLCAAHAARIAGVDRACMQTNVGHE